MGWLFTDVHAASVPQGFMTGNRSRSSADTLRQALRQPVDEHAQAPRQVAVLRIHDMQGKAVRAPVGENLDQRSCPQLLAAQYAVDASRQGLFDHLAARVPMGRQGEPEDISKAVTFLASNAASRINRIELFADGGMVQV
jgi:hypothetical protein